MPLNSELVMDVSVPAGMEIEAGSPFVKVWRLKNSGSERWQGVRLMHKGGDLQTAVDWHAVPDTAVGDTIDLSLSLSAPREPGTYTSRWQLHGADGNPFGPELKISMVSVPGGLNNGRLLAYTTDGAEGVIDLAAGATCTHTVELQNTGGRRWRSNYKLAYLGGPMTAVQTDYPLPATMPGDSNTVTVTVNAPHKAGTAVSYWQMQNEHGVAFGGFIAPEVQVVGGGATAAAFEPQTWRTVIWDITGIFESGRPGGNPKAYQNYDAGIVSYGKHQVTLASGNLARVLDHYFKLSDSPTSQALENEYGDRARAIDGSLKNDARFKQLLITAGDEPAMAQAQDDIFAEGFYNPAVEKAESLGVKTPLGVACIYDTRIQHGGGGLNFLLGLTEKSAGGNIGTAGIDEARWLAVFLDEREALLNRLADKSDAQGQSVNANALRTSTFRVRALRDLLTAQNLALAGTFTVRGHQIKGL